MKIIIRVRSREVEWGWHGIYVDRISIEGVQFHERDNVAEIAEEIGLTKFQVQIAGGVTTLFNALQVVKQLQSELIHTPCPLKLSYMRVGIVLPLCKRQYSPLLWNEILDFCKENEIELDDEYLKRQPTTNYTPVRKEGTVLYN